MKRISIHIIHIIILLFTSNIECTNIEARDEKTFPNGTIVGTYTYIDAQGNQVNVKYFADEKSYRDDFREDMLVEVINSLYTTVHYNPLSRFLSEETCKHLNFLQSLEGMCIRRDFIDLRGYKLPSEDENHETVRSSYGNGEVTTEPSVDTMVPLNLDFPDIENIYTIENPQNATKEIETNNRKGHYSNDNEYQNEDYGIYDSVKKAPTYTVKKNIRWGKDKKIKRHRKVVRKIRQTLDTLIKGVRNM